MLIETFVTQPTMEALAVRVLDRLARIDEVQGHHVLVRPLLQRPADQFRTVVQHQPHGSLPLAAQPLENVRYPTARQACIHLEREGFAGKDVDDAEHAEFASGGERILEKIERPLLVGPLGGAGRPRRMDGKDFRRLRRTVKPSSRYSRSTRL